MASYFERAILLTKLGVPLQAILLFYYPDYHQHVTQKSWLILTKQRSLHDPFMLVQALLILGPLLYHVLYRYSLVDFSKFRGGVVAQESPGETCNCSNKSSICSIHASPKLPDTDVTVGLSSDEISARRNRGPNEIWLGYDWGPWALHFSSNPTLIYILAGAILNLTLCEWRQAGLICLLWLLTFTLPAYQTRSAGEVSESVCLDTSWPTITLRNGKLEMVFIKDLVPGDIVHVSKGLIIPADGFMAACDDLLEIDRSSMTGDATPISIHEKQTCYSGTSVVLGEAFLQIEHTGSKTFVGRTLNSVQEIDGSAQYLKRLFSSGEYLNVVRSIGVILLVVLALPALLWQTSASLIKPWAEIVCITADMAIIAGRFFSRVYITSNRAIITAKVSKSGCIFPNIKAMEALAGIDTICVDNSGIITEDRYILLKPYCVSCDPEALILAASLSINHKSRYNALYRALLKALKQFPQAKAKRDEYRIINSQDMDYENGRLYTQCNAEGKDGTKHFFASGHPYLIYELCQKSSPADHQDCGKALKQAVKTFRKQGLGSLGLAQRKEGGNWEFLGALPFFVPPRQSTALALRLAAVLGVRVKVLSSWNSALVERSARVAGIEGPVLRADMIDDYDDDELVKRIIEADVYTELNVRHREMILEILQDSGRRVAITGSDASDIPALRKADLGIAVAATEEVQSASEAVLPTTTTTHALLTLMSAIRSSRQGYQRLHNYVVRQTVRTLHVLLTMLFVFLVEGKLLDLRLLLMSTHFVEGVEVWLGPKASIQSKPSRWNRAQVLRKIFSLVVVMISGTCVCAYTFPSAERLQLFSFLLMNGNLWIAGLMHSRYTLRGLGSQLAVHLLITALCVTGWVGESSSVNMKAAFHVWLYGLGTFVTVGAVNLLPSIVKARLS